MKQILNLGSGSGQNIPHIIDRGVITNVDIYQDGIDQCKRKYPDLKYVLTSCEDMKFADEYFDEIYAFDVLEHVSDLDKTMANIHQTLKPDGTFYVEVPYEKSEKMLLRVNPDYFTQIGHQRTFEYAKIRETFSKYGFQVVSIQKERGIVNLYLYLIFRLGINITDEMCNVTGKRKIVERLIMGFCIRFDKNILNTKLKYIPIWIITLPIGRVISQIFPKTIVIKLLKI